MGGRDGVGADGGKRREEKKSRRRSEKSPVPRAYIRETFTN